MFVPTQCPCTLLPSKHLVRSGKEFRHYVETLREVHNEKQDSDRY